MKQSIRDIIKLMDDTPSDWAQTKENTIEIVLQSHNKIEVKYSPHQPALMAVVDVKIDGLDLALTYMDSLNIHRAMVRWYKKVSLTHLLKK